MYETEANRKTESQECIPAEVLQRFTESKTTVLRRTALPWSEHCTECVWPSCYSTCELYSPREDGRCRRFVDGMARIDYPKALNSYLLKITFKRWAKLWTPGNIHLRSVAQAMQAENRDFYIGSVLYKLPLPSTLRTFATGKRYSLKKKLAYHAKPTSSHPDSFMLECFNPGTSAVSLSFGIRPVGEGAEFPFQSLIDLAPGFNRVRIPCSEIAAIVNLERPFNVEMIPNDESNKVTLIFGLMDFVSESQPVKAETRDASVAQPKIKCIVWDLDNTMWEGILVEDGAEKLVLKPKIAEILHELDQRGILHSIASKNNHDEALAAVRRMGIDEMFLVPQISWHPKSEAIREIAHQLNIGVDSILFVDDSEFEREEVTSAVPGVRAIDARNYSQILDLEACKVPVTAESRNRRAMYKTEATRQQVASKFSGDYTVFLRDCNIQLNVTPLGEENLERVHELTQRTNQMNFSGNRYDRDLLRKIMATPWLDTHVLEVNDRFGAYGIVGFCIVDSREPLVTDLMFSCRIQSKRVEHAFLAWAIRKYMNETQKDFWATYRKTDKNAPSGKVFPEIGMHEVEVVDGVSRLVFRKGQPIPEDGIVVINVRTPSLTR